MSATITITFLGVTAPAFIWVAALGLFLGTLACLGRLWWLVTREERLYQQLRSHLQRLQPTDGALLHTGVTRERFEALAQVFQPLATQAPGLAAAWQRFRDQVVWRRDTRGQEACWSAESAAQAFDESTVLEARINRSFFAALPGIATGAGLLCTFLAILIALLDVTLAHEQFQGLDTLITGLSGKFLSSIAALSAATVYLLVERRLLPRLSQRLHALTEALDALVPRLTPAQLLVAIEDRLAAQANPWQHLGQELGTALRQGIQDGMGTTLDRMVHTVEELNQWLKGAETQRAEATTGRLEHLLQRLGDSLTSALGGMGQGFAQTLSQATGTELSGVAQALSGSAQLLANMNTQFLATQATMQNIMEMAQHGAAEQMSLGKAQVEELTVVLREMMTQMHDSAGLSVNRMAATLTAVVHDLSTRVTEMSDRMSATVTAQAGQASRTTQIIMGQVDQWSTQSTRQLAQLLDRHQAHLEQVQDVQRTMETTMAQFRTALSEYATVTTGLKGVATQTTTMLSAATTSLTALQDTGGALERVAQQTNAQVERLTATHHQQDEVQQRLAVNLQRYQQLFANVEQAASQLLGQIEQQLERYMATTQQGFVHLSEAADTHFANASRHLGDTVSGLDEHLQDLTDVLERFGRVGGSHGRVA